jgi:DMSO/TMAO reductase YedYZ molybdopterin-dependent catalytic subunit
MTVSRPSPADTVDPRLVVVNADPFNAEAPLDEQIGLITPNPTFYVRSNFNIPRIAAPDWQLRIDGTVERPLTLSYDELLALPSRTVLVTLECAGNGRAGLNPPASGEPWQYHAVSTAEWTGVPLATLLEKVGPESRTREIMVEGHDRGTVATRQGEIPFARSLQLDRALHPDTILAYAMNGEVLPVHHGFPARLLVPGWYGMASVKWVRQITAINYAFDGYYQVERYIMAHPERGETHTVPLSTMRVRSLITEPAAGASIGRAPCHIRGLAWSGQSPVARVEVSTDGGATWGQARFASDPHPYTWRRWEYAWQPQSTGTIRLQSRAFDESGEGQPTEPEWNRLGYANNAIQVIEVTVT